MASKAAYGSNPHADRNPNEDHGWGGYQWPWGVPNALLTKVFIPGGVPVVIRRELAELVQLNYEIAERKYGRRFTRGWTGGYENRPIGGTSIPSNHSRGKAIDNDAQDNPQSRMFITNIPPGLVSDWESTGWFWGGRYSGTYDTMHFEYCFSPADVAGHVAKAKAILHALDPGERADPPASTPETPQSPTPAPQPSEEDDMFDETRDRGTLENTAKIIGGLQNAIGDKDIGILKTSAAAADAAAAAAGDAHNAAEIASQIRNLLVDPNLGVLAAIRSIHQRLDELTERLDALPN